MAQNDDAKKQEEYNNLVSQKNTASNSYQTALSQKAVLETKISRLETAKRSVQNSKEEYGRIKEKDKKDINQKRKWKGNQYDFFINNSTILMEKEQNYYKNIDHILDSINTEISKLENELRNKKTLLNGLLNTINTLATQIENFFN